MSRITVLTHIDRLSCFYSLRPFLLHGGSRRFDFTASPDYCLRRDRNQVLVMVRQFLKPDRVDLELMARLRDKYRTIAFFHDDAGGGIPRLEVLPYVDLFYNKALFRDRSLYGQHLYGKELYSDYYHRRYGVADPDPRERAVADDPRQLAKLRLSWNIGIGDYPRHKWRQRAGTAAALLGGPRWARPFYLSSRLASDPVGANQGRYPVHARLGLMEKPSIAYHRRLILDRIGADPRFLVGPVPQPQYNREVAHSRIVLSPFGWGELCMRDFEAVRAGALLLKPDMSHLETWPNVFLPGETYAPFDWDAEKLIETAARYLDDETARLRIARAATDHYREQLAELPRRIEKILEEIDG